MFCDIRSQYDRNDEDRGMDIKEKERVKRNDRVGADSWRKSINWLMPSSCSSCSQMQSRQARATRTLYERHKGKGNKYK